MKNIFRIILALLLAFQLSVPSLVYAEIPAPTESSAGRLTSGEETQQRKLRRLGIREYEVPIHEQSAEWLTKEFKDAYAIEYPVNISRMIRNIIWQQRQLRVRKEDPLPPFEGNIRSFWYAYVKIPLARLGIQKEEHYKIMVYQFVDLVRKENLMRYKDIGFTDENKYSKKIGSNYHIILFSEKQGQFPLLVKLHEKYDITVIALGGQPSLLSAEYFVDDLRERKIDIRQKFYIFSLVDYDPSGWIIRNAFIDDLYFYGIKTTDVTDLVWPTLLEPEILRVRIYPVPNPPNMRTKNQNWLEITNGIEGQLYGIEADAFTPDFIELLLKPEIQKLLGKQK